MLIICRKTFSVSCLLGPFLNHFSLFDQKLYKQHDGVEVGSPLGPTLANVFYCYHEKFEFKIVLLN